MSKQFPARHGDAPREVAQRTPDGRAGDVFRRTFTIQARSHTMGLPGDHWSHTSRFTEVVADAVRRGLHPKSAVRFESESAHPNDPKSVDLVYAVDVVPASVDTDSGSTVSPSDYAVGGRMAVAPDHDPEIPAG